MKTFVILLYLGYAAAKPDIGLDLRQNLGQQRFHSAVQSVNSGYQNLQVPNGGFASQQLLPSLNQPPVFNQRIIPNGGHIHGNNYANFGANLNGLNGHSILNGHGIQTHTSLHQTYGVPNVANNGLSHFQQNSVLLNNLQQQANIQAQQNLIQQKLQALRLQNQAKLQANLQANLQAQANAIQGNLNNYQTQHHVQVQPNLIQGNINQISSLGHGGGSSNFNIDAQLNNVRLPPSIQDIPPPVFQQNIVQPPVQPLPIQPPVQPLPIQPLPIQAPPQQAFIPQQPIIETGGAIQQQPPIIQPQLVDVKKHIYVYTAPQDVEVQQGGSFTLAQRRKNYKIIFIKTPSYDLPSTYIQQLQQAQQDKTIVYVLVKKPDESVVNINSGVQTTASKPEVYFIRYKTKQDIQTQLPIGGSISDQVGGVVHDGHASDGEVSNDFDHGVSVSNNNYQVVGLPNGNNNGNNNGNAHEVYGPP